MRTVGPYRLEALVGRGATGSVWRARRLGPVPRVVALKRSSLATDDHLRDRLRHEATVLAELDHPHIVHILDVVDDGDAVAVVMALARGGSLQDLLAERGSLTAGEAVAVLAPVAEALGSAHRRGLVHGDVKPANILLTADGEPLLGDFGTARPLRAGTVEDRRGPGRPVVGTGAYLDPELVTTGRPEPTNDVYGLAVVAYRCLTGRLPHGGATDGEVVAAAGAGHRRSLLEDPSVPRGLARVVEAALDRDRSRRPVSATALAEALRAALPPTAPIRPAPSRSAVGIARTAGSPAGPGGPGRFGSGPERIAPEPAGAAGQGVDRSGPATRTFGPRPPEPEGRTRGVPTKVVVAAVAVVVGAGATVGLGLRSGSDGGRGPSTDDAAPPATGLAPCPDAPALAVPPGAEVIEADLLGNGCAVPLVWDGRVLTVSTDPSDPSPRRYELASRRGGPGQLLVGDWDCDGTHTPGYYQPTTGLVSTFDAIPERLGTEVAGRPWPSGVLGGRAEVVTGADGCDEVEVAPRA